MHAAQQFAGGGLFELGSHLVDALVRLLGEPRAVTPFLRKHGDFADDLKKQYLEFLQDTLHKVYLELQVKAAPKWRRNETMLERLGL